MIRSAASARFSLLQRKTELTLLNQLLKAYPKVVNEQQQLRLRQRVSVQDRQLIKLRHKLDAADNLRAQEPAAEEKFASRDDPERVEDLQEDTTYRVEIQI